VCNYLTPGDIENADEHCKMSNQHLDGIIWTCSNPCNYLTPGYIENFDRDCEIAN
jgi:hypothetical protein